MRLNYTFVTLTGFQTTVINYCKYIIFRGSAPFLPISFVSK